MPTGFQITGFIQYASLDATPGLCNKDDNPAPTPANPPLPAQCKITGGWIEVNNNVIRIPQSTVVIFPNTLLTWEEAFELNPNTHQTDPIIQTGLAMSDTVRFPGNLSRQRPGKHRQRPIYCRPGLPLPGPGKLHPGLYREIRLRQRRHVGERNAGADQRSGHHVHGTES